MKAKNKRKYISTVRLSKKHLEFLNSLSRCCCYSGGKRLSRSEIIRTFADVTRSLNIKLSEVKSEKQLTKKICEAFCRER